MNDALAHAVPMFLVEEANMWQATSAALATCTIVALIATGEPDPGSELIKWPSNRSIT